MLRAGRGFTLPEMVLAMVLTVWLGGVVSAMLVSTEMVVRHQNGRMELYRTIRSGALFLARETTGLVSGPDPDLLLMAPDRIHYRALRGLGVSCGARPDTLLIRQDLRFGVRSWQPDIDSLRLYVMGDTARGSMDRWERLPLVSVSAHSCPSGASALALGTRFPPGFVPAVDLAPGAPVVVFEPTEIRLYQSGGREWLGLRSLSGGGNIQPALGPLAAAGLEFVFLDRAEAPTTDPQQVAAVVMTLRAESFEEVRRGRGHPGGRLIDSQTVWVTLRNLP